MDNQPSRVPQPVEMRQTLLEFIAYHEGPVDRIDLLIVEPAFAALDRLTEDQARSFAVAPGQILEMGIFEEFLEIVASMRDELNEMSGAFAQFLEEESASAMRGIPREAAEEIVTPIAIEELGDDAIDKRCAICYVPYGEGEADEVEAPGRLPCGHVLGSVCVLNWLAEHSNCPVCRAEFDKPLGQ